MSTANIALAVGIAGLLAVLLWGQIKGKLDAFDAFKDEDKRTSMGRVCAFGAWLASTWYLMANTVSDTLYLGYVLIWALLMMGSKGLDVIATWVRK